jgi:hypothetical protein
LLAALLALLADSLLLLSLLLLPLSLPVFVLLLTSLKVSESYAVFPPVLTAAELLLLWALLFALPALALLL